jgi:hypothetical protein
MENDTYSVPIEILVYCPKCNAIMKVEVTTSSGTVEIELPSECECGWGGDD